MKSLLCRIYVLHSFFFFLQISYNYYISLRKICIFVFCLFYCDFICYYNLYTVVVSCFIEHVKMFVKCILSSFRFLLAHCAYETWTISDPIMIRFHDYFYTFIRLHRSVVRGFGRSHNQRRSVLYRTGLEGDRFVFLHILECDTIVKKIKLYD